MQIGGSIIFLYQLLFNFRSNSTENNLKGHHLSFIKVLRLGETRRFVLKFRCFKEFPFPAKYHMIIFCMYLVDNETLKIVSGVSLLSLLPRDIN